jgi:hypothetical protein
MSSLQTTDLYSEPGLDRERTNYRFLLALLFIGLVLVIASPISTVAIGQGIDNGSLVIGL